MTFSTVTLQAIQHLLTQFANQESATEAIATIFGANVDSTQVAHLLNQWQSGNFSDLPTIEVRSYEDLNGALGAYAAVTDTIYISEALVQQGNEDALVAVLLEEIGHGVDARLNVTDTPGDEGHLFSAAVRGEHISAEQMQMIVVEDDTTTIIIDGQSVDVEQATIKVTQATDQALRNAINQALTAQDKINVIDLRSISGQTITLTDALPTIQGKGIFFISDDTVTINGDDQHQILSINLGSPERLASFEGITFRDGYAKGGDGSTGGGGGLGAGGALFVNTGSVFIKDSTFTGNRAVGGSSNEDAGDGGHRASGNDETGEDGEDGGSGGGLNVTGDTIFFDSEDFTPGSGGSGGEASRDGHAGGDGGSGAFGTGGGGGGGGGAPERVSWADDPPGTDGGDGGNGGNGGGGGGGGGTSGGENDGGDLPGGSEGTGGAFGGAGIDGDSSKSDGPSDGDHGGGGAGLGGAIFVRQQQSAEEALELSNVTFSSNSVAGGNADNERIGNRGKAYGDAIFYMDGTGESNYSTKDNSNSPYSDNSTNNLPLIAIAPISASETDAVAQFKISVDGSLPSSGIELYYYVSNTSSESEISSAINSKTNEGISLADAKAASAAEKNIQEGTDFSYKTLHQHTLTQADIDQGYVDLFDVTDDAIYDPGESFTVQLLAAPDYRVGEVDSAGRTATVELKENEPLIQIRTLKDGIEGAPNALQRQDAEFKLIFDKAAPKDFNLHFDAPEFYIRELPNDLSTVDQDAISTDPSALLESGTSVRGTSADPHPDSDYKLYWRYDNQPDSRNYFSDEDHNTIGLTAGDGMGDKEIIIGVEMIDNDIFEQTESVTLTLRDNVEPIESGKDNGSIPVSGS